MRVSIPWLWATWTLFCISFPLNTRRKLGLTHLLQSDIDPRMGLLDGNPFLCLKSSLFLFTVWATRVAHLYAYIYIYIYVCVCVYVCIWGGNGNPLPCSCLENSMDRGAWWATAHEVAKGRTQLSSYHSLMFHLFWAVLGLSCCAAFSSCSEWRLLFIAVRWLLTAVASLARHTGSVAGAPGL